MKSTIYLSILFVINILLCCKIEKPQKNENPKFVHSLNDLGRDQENNKVSVLIFTKEGCPACKGFEETRKEIYLKYKYDDRVSVLIIQIGGNITGNEDIRKEYNVSTVPTILILKDNEVRVRYDAAHARERTLAHISTSIEVVWRTNYKVKKGRA